MDVADIKTEFGLYYKNGGQGIKDLVQILYAKTETDALFTRVDTEDTIIRRGSSIMTRILQPFQKKWTPLGGLTVKPAEIKLFPMKVDFEENPDELEATWLGFLADKNLDRTQWPFVKWLIQNHIIGKHAEDYEINEVFKGEYAAPVDGTPGPVSTAMDGAKKLINDNITAGGTDPIVTGAIATDPVDYVDQVELFMAAINPLYQDFPMQLAMSKVLARRFQQGMRAKYNMNYAQTSDLTKVEGYNTTVVGVTSMTGSSKIWCTPRENAILGVKKSSNITVFKIESVDRLVKLFTDYYKGIGFILPELVFTNDQDLPV
jgi:hypothetical protein